jgi:hypothetical protein
MGRSLSRLHRGGVIDVGVMKMVLLVEGRRSEVKGEE